MDGYLLGVLLVPLFIFLLALVGYGVYCLNSAWLASLKRLTNENLQDSY